MDVNLPSTERKPSKNHRHAGGAGGAPQPRAVEAKASVGLVKKDRKRYEITMKKIGEICSNSDVEHYKNLSNDMKEFQHHDTIYTK